MLSKYQLRLSRDSFEIDSKIISMKKNLRACFA